MGTYLDIDGDPNEVSGKGAILRSIGETFRARMQAVLGEIQAVDAERPWGSDTYGRAFEETYNQVPEGADTSLRAMLRDAMSAAGEHLIRVGDTTVRAMTEFQGVDATNEADLKRIYDA